MSAGSKIAVVLFNLGGPDGPADVRPFLENLFSDPAIIGAPDLVRRPLAALIARLRERSAIANYAVMGGGSPIVPLTREQARALQGELFARMPRTEVKTFIAMRYWTPTIAETAEAVRAFAPDEVVLVPLYPQFSTTTTESSMKAWRKVYFGEYRAICCWYGNLGLIQAHVEQIERTWVDAGKPKVRLLFSAHGLPESIASSGDPYQWQIEATCAKVAALLGDGWDWQVCYQSRVGPLKWIGPTTPEAIRQAARDGVGVLIDPIAFVSEHIETLVELDRDYALLGKRLNIPVYLRAPTVGVSSTFIGGLADAVERALGKCESGPDGEPCPASLNRCGRWREEMPIIYDL